VSAASFFVVTQSRGASDIRSYVCPPTSQARCHGASRHRSAMTTVSCFGLGAPSQQLVAFATLVCLFAGVQEYGMAICSKVSEPCFARSSLSIARFSVALLRCLRINITVHQNINVPASSMPPRLCSLPPFFEGVVFWKPADARAKFREFACEHAKVVVGLTGRLRADRHWAV
jgi:hypothetical protein